MTIDRRYPISAQSLSIIAGAAIMLSLSMGMRQSMGLFLQPVTGSHELSIGDFTLAIAIQNIVWGVTQPLAGAFADRYGCRSVGIAGALLYAAGLVLPVLAPGVLGFTAGAGVIVGVALSCTTMSITMTASARAVPPARRSFVLGVVSGAGSLGTFIAAPLAQSLIRSHGWQIAMVSFVALAAAMLPAALLVGRVDRLPPQVPRGPAPAQASRPGQLASAAPMQVGAALSEAFGHGGYLTMAIAFFVCGLQLVFITNHMPTYLASCGLDPMLGAQMLAVIGLFNIAGSVLFGWLGDRFPKQILLGLIYILRSLIIASYFALPPSVVSTLVFAAAMGLLWLGVVPLVNGLVAEIFGTTFMGMLTGVAFFSHQVGSFVGVWGGGLIYERLGSYDLAWKSAVAIGLTAGVAQLLMTVRPAPRMALSFEVANQLPGERTV